MSKKEERIESKKRKAAAFLRLVNESDTIKKGRKENDETSEDKSAKMDTTNNAETNVWDDKESVVNMSWQTAAQVAEDELIQLRKALRERQKAAMQRPKVFLNLEELAMENGRMISKENTVPQLPPIFMLDLQHLLLFGVQGNKSNLKPRWCQLLRCGKVSSVVVMVMDSVSCTEIQKYPECFKRLQSEFEMSVEMVSPSQYGSSVPEDLFYVPVSIRQMKSLKVIAEKQKKKLARLSKVTYDMEKIVSLHKKDKYPRTCLLLNTNQMLKEGYPLPVNYKNNQYKHFVYTKEKYETVTSLSPMYAVDCEMCLTTANRSELTRVSIVDESHRTVYDTFVKPYNRITNYLTRYSGITKKILDPVKTRLEDVQRDICKLLPSDAILCGHSLNSDLLALQMFHPYVIDTSVIYNLSGIRYMKPGLRRLSQMFLGQNIQENEGGHDSIEDAKASLELVQLKLSQGVEFGDVVMGALIMSTRPVDPSLLDNVDVSAESSSDQNCDQSKHSDDNLTTEHAELSNDSQNVGNKLSDSKQTPVDNTIEEHLESADSNTEKETGDEEMGDKETGDKEVSDSTKSDSDSISSAKFIHPVQNDVMARRRAFFQREGEFSYQNFFKLVRECSKTAALLAEKEIVNAFDKQDILTMEADSDKTIKSLSKSYVQYHDFVYSSFPSFKQYLTREDQSEEALQKTLKKLDKKIWKVSRNVKQNALLVVVLSGRSEDGTEHNAKTFIKIT